MPDGPDVRALGWILGSVWGVRRPTSCLGCPFSVRGRPKGCALLGLAEVRHEDPPCTQENWHHRARAELAALESDSALLAAVARDAREESSMYNRGLAEGAAAEREACCRGLCWDCREGQPVRLEGEVWCHPPAAGGEPPVPCRAGWLRRRAEQDGR